MGLIFVDGFDSYGTSDGSSLDGFDRKWPSASLGTFEIAAGRFSGKAVHFNSTFQRWIQTPVFAVPTITVGCAVRFSAFPSIPNGDGTCAFLSFYDSSANLGINVALTPTGEVAVYLGGSQLAVTTSLALTVNTWHTFELSVVVGNSGSYDLHVDGQNVLSASADTQPGSSALVDVVRIGKNVNSSMLPMVDDLVIDDQAGAFLTDWKINTVFPSADSVVDGTPSTGSDNYAVVDENPANGDTDYVGSTSGDEDRFSFPSVSGTNVVAVVVTAVTRQTDASPFDITLIANQAGAPQAIGSSDYVVKSEVFVSNPDTGLAWEISEVNSAEFGYKVL